MVGKFGPGPRVVYVFYHFNGFTRGRVRVQLGGYHDLFCAIQRGETVQTPYKTGQGKGVG